MSWRFARDIDPAWAPIKRLTPFGLFRPSALLSGARAPWPDVAALVALAAGAVAVAWWLLRRRDL